jgi:hypothetical protein
MEIGVVSVAAVRAAVEELKLELVIIQHPVGALRDAAVRDQRPKAVILKLVA